MYLLVSLLAWRLGYLENISYRVRGYDSVFYYIWLSSALFDHDLDFTNDLAMFSWGPDARGISPKGRPENFSPIGSAVAWAPLAGLAHAISLAQGSPPARGYGPVYYTCVYIGNSLYALAGIILAFVWLTAYVRRQEAFLGCAAIMLASQITYYFWSDTAMSHNVSLFATALFLVACQRRGLGVLSGFAAGFMALVRWQDCFMIAVPLAQAFHNLKAKQESPQKVLAGCAAFFFACGAVFFLQLLAWRAVYGPLLAFPHDPGQINPLRLHIFDVLFSTRHGLFSWHPLLLAGALGLALLWKRQKALTVGLVLAVALQILFNASLADWHAAWSFGARRFVHLLPVFALGLAMIAETYGRRGFVLVAVLAALLGVWNQLFIYQYQKGLIPPDRPLTASQMVWDKFSLGKVQRARQAAVLAVLHYRQKGVDQEFSRLAAYAFEQAPSDALARATWALSCVFYGHHPACVPCLAAWQKEHPQVMAFAWAYSAMLLQDGKKDQALAVVQQSVLPRDPVLADFLGQKILAGGQAALMGDKKFLMVFQSQMMQAIQEGL